MATAAQQPRPQALTLSALIDFACGSHARAAAFLVVLSLAAFLPGFFTLPPIDRDEARFAQATKQMLETGDYLDIHFQNEVRYKKPVGIYWLQAGAVKAGEALGGPRAQSTIWLYRMPSLFGALGAVLLTYWCALAFVGRRAAVLAAAMMATSLLLAVEARLAKTDAVLLATVVAAMGAMARVYLRSRRDDAVALVPWALPAIFWTALAAGVLIKGPLILMIVGLTAAGVSILDRSGRWLLRLRPLPGLLWFALLVAPWFVLILNRAGDAFLAESVGRDMAGKIFSGQESHGAPPGLYLLLFWVTFWPGALLAGLAAPTVWRARREPGAQFLLAWLVPSWIVFELVVTKLPHYVLPLYPAIAILIAGIIERGALSESRWMKPALIGWLIYPLAMAIGVLTGYIWLGNELGLIAWPTLAGAVIFGLIAWRLYDLDGPERALLRAGAAAVLVSFTVFALLVPSLDRIFPSVAIANALRSSDCPAPLVATAGFAEPSLVFLLGTPTRLTDAHGAVEFLRQGGPCRFALLEGRHERIFGQHAQAAGLRYSPLTRIDGLNFSTGRSVTIAIFRSNEEPQ
jgi:4-amino-4-deoxy-L-arabinose transferase-like glycosyltransferase